MIAREQTKKHLCRCSFELTRPALDADYLARSESVQRTVRRSGCDPLREEGLGAGDAREDHGEEPHAEGDQHQRVSDEHDGTVADTVRVTVPTTVHAGAAVPRVEFELQEALEHPDGQPDGKRPSDNTESPSQKNFHLVHVVLHVPFNQSSITDTAQHTTFMCYAEAMTDHYTGEKTLCQYKNKKPPFGGSGMFHLGN